MDHQLQTVLTQIVEQLEASSIEYSLVGGLVERNRSNLDWGYCEEVAGQLEEVTGLEVLAKILDLQTDGHRDVS